MERNCACEESGQPDSAPVPVQLLTAGLAGPPWAGSCLSRSAGGKGERAEGCLDLSGAFPPHCQVGIFRQQLRVAPLASDAPGKISLLAKDPRLRVSDPARPRPLLLGENVEGRKAIPAVQPRNGCPNPRAPALPS